MTSNPGLANFATFPAVNWFSYYTLKKQLQKRGFCVFNKFDLTDLSKKLKGLRVNIYLKKH
jgi:hypothetical protein